MFLNKEKLFSLIHEEVKKLLHEEEMPPPTVRKGITSTVPSAIGRPDLAGRKWKPFIKDPDDVWDPLRTDQTDYQKSRQYGMALPVEVVKSLRYLADGNWYVQDISLPKGGPITVHGSHQRGVDVDVSVPMLHGVKVKSHPRWDGRRRFVGKRAANKGHAVYKTKKGTLGFFSPIAMEGGRTKSYIDPQRSLDLIQHVLPVTDKIFLDRAHIRAIRSYARKPVEKGGLGWDRRKTNSILRKVHHVDNHGHHFHIRFIDVDNPLSKRIESYPGTIPKKWAPERGKGIEPVALPGEKDMVYQDFKQFYDDLGEELFNTDANIEFPAEFRIQYFREKTDNLKKAKYEMDKMYTPSAVGKTWADPEALDVGAGKFETPDEPIKVSEPVDTREKSVNQPKKSNFTPLDPEVDDDVKKFLKDLIPAKF